MFEEFVEQSWPTTRLRIDAIHLEAHRTAVSLLKKGLFPAESDAQRVDKSKLHAGCDGTGRPVSLRLTERQLSDFKGTVCLLNTLSNAKELLADCGYDTTWFRKTLLEKILRPAFLQSGIGKKFLLTIKSFISNGSR